MSIVALVLIDSAYQSISEGLEGCKKIKKDKKMRV